MLVVFQLAVVLLLTELALRLVAPRHRGLRMMLDWPSSNTDFSNAGSLPELMDRTMLGFNPLGVEYGFVLNSRSFRTREYEPGPVMERFRLVALGDSFTFASGALPHEDHWTTVVEDSLEGWTARPAEVLRLGVPDTGPAFQLRLWQLEASHLEPDMVVLAFFVGNDFIDHQGDCGVFGGGERGFSGRLASVSALYRVVRNLTRVLGSGPGLNGGRPTDASMAGGEPVPGYRESFDPDRPSFSRKRFIGIEAERMALCLRSEEEAFRTLADRVTGVVLDLADEVEASGARFVVMVIPDQYQVDPILVDQVLAATGNRAEDYDLDRPQRYLITALESAGIEVLDLLPCLRDASRGEPVYRPRDTHWNRRGNEIAAAALVGMIVPEATAGEGVLFTDDLESGSVLRWSMEQNVHPG